MEQRTTWYNKQGHGDSQENTPSEIDGRRHLWGKKKCGAFKPNVT